MTYKESFRELGIALMHLSQCLWRTFTNCATDIAQCAIKHPIATMLLIYVLCHSFYTVATARAERDKLNKQCYEQSISIDSLRLLVELRH